jgi:peptidoglycan/LPS O-acetylase OafA/YrhL
VDRSSEPGGERGAPTSHTGPTVAATQDRRPRHVPALDGVRGIAVTMVVALHLGYAFFPGHSQDLFPGGFLGVDVFFVLSGFLITGILVEERAQTGSLSFRRFYWRRAYRLLPALAVLGVVHLGYTIVVGRPLGPELRSLGSMALYFNNWAQAAGWETPADLDHAWSLSIEEQFYAVWPLAILLLMRSRRRETVVAGILAVAVAAALWRWRLWESSGFNAAYFRTDARIDNLLIGAAAALAWRWGWISGVVARRGAAVALPGLLALGLHLDQERDDEIFRWGLSLAALLGAALVLGAAAGTSPWNGLLRSRVLVALGRVSYGVYLWHVPVIYLTLRHLERLPAPAEVAVSLAGTAAAVLASWVLVERPLLDRKDRRQPRVSAAGPV